MCNAIKEHLLHQKRPRYLQATDNDGNYVWENKNKKEGNSETVTPELGEKVSILERSMREEEESSGSKASMEEREEESLDSTVQRLNIKRAAPDDIGDQDEGSSERVHKRTA